MKSGKILKCGSIAIWIAQLVVELLTLVIVMRLDMLPGKLLTLVIALLLILWLVIGGLLFLHGKHSSISSLRRYVALILSFVVVLGCAFASSVASQVRDVINNVGNATEVTTVMNVYVRADDPARSLTDTSGYVFAVVDGLETEKTQKAVRQVKELQGAELNVKNYPGLVEMFDDLLNGSADAVIMSDAYLSILESSGEETLVNLSDRIRVVHEIHVVEYVQSGNSEGPGNNNPGQAQDKHPNETEVSVKDITNQPFIVYVSGSDTRSQKLTTSNSDVNILVVVNPSTKQILLLNTPRDYYIPNPEGNGSLDKLTHCGCYGIDCSVQALSDLYGIDVNYYGQINFSGFETLIDAIDGVTIYSDIAFSARDTYIEVGENYLDGASALDYARERYHLAAGDNARGENQMKVIKAVIEKMTSGATLITKYSDILDSLAGMFMTNLSNQDISKLVKMQLSDGAQWNIQSYAVNGMGGSDITYSIPGLYVYVTYPDEGMVEYGSELINRVISGETLSEEDVVYSAD